MSRLLRSHAYRTNADGVIVLTPSEERKFLRALRKEYDNTHWGAPDSTHLATILAPDPNIPLTELGALCGIAYLTRKGDDELVEWVHAFNGRARPVLAYNATGLVILGGTYVVTDRGIEG